MWSGILLLFGVIILSLVFKIYISKFQLFRENMIEKDVTLTSPNTENILDRMGSIEEDIDNLVDNILDEEDKLSKGKITNTEYNLKLEAFKAALILKQAEYDKLIEEYQKYVSEGKIAKEAQLISLQVGMDNERFRNQEIQRVKDERAALQAEKDSESNAYRIRSNNDSITGADGKTYFGIPFHHIDGISNQITVIGNTNEAQGLYSTSHANNDCAIYLEHSRNIPTVINRVVVLARGGEYTTEFINKAGAHGILNRATVQSFYNYGALLGGGGIGGTNRPPNLRGKGGHGGGGGGGGYDRQAGDGGSIINLSYGCSNVTLKNGSSSVPFDYNGKTYCCNTKCHNQNIADCGNDKKGSCQTGYHENYGDLGQGFGYSYGNTSREGPTNNGKSTGDRPGPGGGGPGGGAAGNGLAHFNRAGNGGRYDTNNGDYVGQDAPGATDDCSAGGGGYGGGRGGSSNSGMPGGGGGGGGDAGGDAGRGGYSILSIDGGNFKKLYNLQGGNNIYGPLFYAGTSLPENYYICITSTSQYGQLFCTGWFWPNSPDGTNFKIDIDKNSVFNTSGTSVFKCVFKGVEKLSEKSSIVKLNNNKRYRWRLISKGNNMYDLEMKSITPNDTITCSSVRLSGSATVPFNYNGTNFCCNTKCFNRNEADCGNDVKRNSAGEICQTGYHGGDGGLGSAGLGNGFGFSYTSAS